ncbi:hypothetical protein D3C78_1278440 [compost metagenome]
MQPGIHAQQRDHRQQQGQRLGAIAEQAEQQRGTEQEPQHRIAQGLARQRGPVAGGVLDDIVAAVALALRDLRVGQATLGGLQPLQALDGDGTTHQAVTSAAMNTHQRRCMHHRRPATSIGGLPPADYPARRSASGTDDRTGRPAAQRRHCRKCGGWSPI